MIKIFLIFSVMGIGLAHASDELTLAVERAHMDCSNIASGLVPLQKMAGINTVVSGVGAASGGVALGTGLAKIKYDNELGRANTWYQDQLDGVGYKDTQKLDADTVVKEFNTYVPNTGIKLLESDEHAFDAAVQKSKTLGNIRTGGLAVGVVGNVAGAMIAHDNRVDDDLRSQINKCITAVKKVSDIRAQARISGELTNEAAAYTRRIIDACDMWSTVDVDTINDLATQSAVSSGVGAGLGVIGTATSLAANKKDDNALSYSKKQENLNAVSNVIAGATVTTGIMSTIFNAKQIKVIKRATEVAENCIKAFANENK